MALTAGRRAGTELRKNPRRQFHYQAKILTSETGRPSACAIADISECGARIILAMDEELPPSFLLLLSSQGSTRRICRLVWQDGLTVGVEFPDRVP
ncbi:MAG TPA: PilZ domain-containing protein [Xanthobacteraceae bacterium]|nr:PilZ domain-containing protein [Xanthobacteraceae bacterium]